MLDSTSDRKPRLSSVAGILLGFEPELAVVGKAGDASRPLSQSRYQRPGPILLDLDVLRRDIASTRLCPSTRR
jgi:hypothetical protein